MNANQMDLDLPGAPEDKSYPGANGVKLPYSEQDGKIIRIALSDKLILPVTNQKGGHIYTFVPDYGRLERRGKNAKTSFLSAAAAIRRSLELKESITGHGQSIVRDAEEQGELLRAAEAKSLEMEAENTRLGDENARLREQLAAAQAQAASSAAGSSQDRQPRMRNQSINVRALQWAYAQDDLAPTAKDVLVSFAIHCDERGYSWPGVDHIASRWGMDRATVRRQIKALLVRRMISTTNKRRGATGQVKVYRLPKIAYESGGKRHPFENDESGGKAGRKRGTSGGEFTPNNGIMNKEHHHHDELITLGNSIPATPSNASTSSSSFVEGHQKHQSQSARDHVKWPEYATYCGSQKGKRGKDGRVHDGIPNEKGFWAWLNKQKPQWRNKRKQPDYIDGFVLDGKFLTPEEANRMAAENPRLLDEGRFRPARKGHDGKVVIISEVARHGRGDTITRSEPWPIQMGTRGPS
jgi:hypothetical protein